MEGWVLRPGGHGEVDAEGSHKPSTAHWITFLSRDSAPTASPLNYN